METLVYPAIFEQQEDGTFLVVFPDLPGCATEGKNLSEALIMAEDCLKTWGQATVDDSQPLPKPSSYRDIPQPQNGFVNMVGTDLRDAKPIIKSVSLPRWMADEAAKAHLSLSKVLQEALSERLA